MWHNVGFEVKWELVGLFSIFYSLFFFLITLLIFEKCKFQAAKRQQTRQILFRKYLAPFFSIVKRVSGEFVLLLLLLLLEVEEEEEKIYNLRLLQKRMR